MTLVLTGIKCCSRPPCLLPSVSNSCPPSLKKESGQASRLIYSLLNSLWHSWLWLNSCSLHHFVFSFKPPVLIHKFTVIAGIALRLHMGCWLDDGRFLSLKWKKNEKVGCLRPDGLRMTCTRRNPRPLKLNKSKSTLITHIVYCLHSFFLRSRL